MVGKRNGQGLTFHGVNGGREGIWERGPRLRVKNGDDGEGTGVEGERATISGGERKKSGGTDGGRREVKVQGKGDVGSEWVSRFSVRVRINGRH